MVLFKKVIMEKTKVIIDRFEGDFAILKTESDSFSIPRSILSPSLKEGDIRYITVSDSQEEESSQEELARSVLNEVLKED